MIRKIAGRRSLGNVRTTSQKGSATKVVDSSSRKELGAQRVQYPAPVHLERLTNSGSKRTTN